MAVNALLPRMRTVSQCLEEIKTIDNNSCITEWYIRTLCKENKIVYFQSGNKLLINFDYLLSYFNTNMGVN